FRRAKSGYVEHRLRRGAGGGAVSIGRSAQLTETPETEERHGSAGALRTTGGLGALRGPHVLQDAVLLEAPVDRAARDGQCARGSFFIVLEHRQSLEDQLALDVGQGRYALGRGYRRRGHGRLAEAR